MKKDELNRYIQLGKTPITVFQNEIYSGIAVLIKVKKNNIAFLDFEDGFSSEGNLRISFKFKSFDDMICSIEEYSGFSINDLEIIKEYIPYTGNLYADWQQLKIDLYNNNIKMLKKYESFSIGDIYWRGLFYKEITPYSNAEEIKRWFESH